LSAEEQLELHASQSVDDSPILIPEQIDYREILNPPHKNILKGHQERLNNHNGSFSDDEIYAISKFLIQKEYRDPQFFTQFGLTTEPLLKSEKIKAIRSKTANNISKRNNNIEEFDKECLRAVIEKIRYFLRNPDEYLRFCTPETKAILEYFDKQRMSEDFLISLALGNSNKIVISIAVASEIKPGEIDFDSEDENDRQHQTFSRRLH
jgi:hypothetical protein